MSNLELLKDQWHDKCLELVRFLQTPNLTDEAIERYIKQYQLSKRIYNNINVMIEDIKEYELL